MKNKSELSVRSNMAFGFIPVIITILLSEFIPADIAAYTGAATGILYCILHNMAHKPLELHFILHSSTAILIMFGIITFGMEYNEWPRHLLPLTLEITIILPLLALFLNRKRYARFSYKEKTANDLNRQVRATTLTISSICIFFGLTTIHFAFITLGFIVTRSLDNGFMWSMLHVAPAIVFIACIIMGQIEIQILKGIKAPEFVPVVTPQGEVIGSVDKNLVEEYKNEHTHPIIRIATVSHNMLFLAERPMQRVIDKGKVDIPLETYLLFKEDIKSGVERLLKETFPETEQNLKPAFSIKYKFRNEETDRIVYLFILDLGTKDKILIDSKFENGKLWTFQQIEFNLSRNYFSEMFENEYDHLKLIIETRGIYKEA